MTRKLKFRKLFRVSTMLVFVLIQLEFGKMANGQYREGKHQEQLYRRFLEMNGKLNQKFLRMNNDRIGTLSGPTSEFGQHRGGLGVLILGYVAKACLYAYAYFKLICLCMFISLLFLMLCPLLPFLIPALLIILVIAAALSITIPLIAVTAGADDGDLTVITN